VTWGRTAYISATSTNVDEAWASRFVAALEATRGLADTVVILLAANGGNQTASDALYSLLVGWPTRIVTWATGPIMSAGITLYLAGSERLATPSASFLLHGCAWDPSPHAKRRVALSEGALEGILAQLKSHNAAQAQRYRERCVFQDPQEIDALIGNNCASRPLPWLVNRGVIHGVREVSLPADAMLLSVESGSVDDALVVKS
jgi:ATP-dependent protease ClpP protease subunit